MQQISKTHPDETKVRLKSYALLHFADAIATYMENVLAWEMPVSVYLVYLEAD